AGDAPAVHLDDLPVGIDPRAVPAHDLPVDLDPSLGDQLLAPPAAADTGGGKHLLQADATGYVGERIVPGLIRPVHAAWGLPAARTVRAAVHVRVPHWPPAPAAALAAVTGPRAHRPHRPDPEQACHCPGSGHRHNPRCRR